ncbi:WD40-repeat-containing domain protein [Mycena leptocephala]|nr:WD40-repeat-containing domain protein [Mycena leptocephala]
MLALATTHQLSLIDPQALRRPPSSLPSCLSLLAPCTASAWSPDNLYLFLSSPNTIHQYNPALNTLTDIFSSPETVTHLVCKTRSSLAFATADKIHILESTKVVQTFDSHKAPITSLALSNDLLASTSAGAAHVHNLLLGSHTILRGLNLAGQRITACAFHPHSRARLLLGVGKQLIVYDTTRPSGPSKIIPMNDTSTGDIVSVACSPFSKTLVAVASASGNVGLVDLDKEKGTLTSIAFSPSGDSIYLGTENGKLLILDLRALDKPPKAVVISEDGCRVQTMTVQVRLLSFSRYVDSSTKPTITTKVSNSVEGTARRPSTTVASTGASAKAVPKVGSSSSKDRIARVGSGASPIFSPVRDPEGNSMSVVDISMQSSTRGKGKKGPVLTASEDVKSARVGGSASRLSTTSRVRKTSITESASARSDTHLRPVASATRTVSDPISAKSARSRSGSSVSRASSSASQRPSIPPVPPLPASFAARTALAESRTPSPDLPSVNGDPTTPLPTRKGGVAMGTPDANHWIEAEETRSKGKGKGKTVIFKEGSENVPEDERKERERSLSMQISPRRPASSAGLGNSASWAPSPLRNAIPASPVNSSSSAHDLLRSIVHDVMFEYQQEARTEMVGLHLDLLRMGRNWKKELRELMDDYVGDLREENKRLREENEHLRRGY